jgi:beta-glucosidase/6-phospho-beta-glucosidase/beta-galactosidase
MERWAWLDHLRLPHWLWKRLDDWAGEHGWMSLSDYANYRAHVR